VPTPSAGDPGTPAIDRLELRIDRLQTVFRFTFAFHAREVRFERDDGHGFERVFPETFSFQSGRHDPSELFLQLDDLLRRARLISARANRRDARLLVTRLCSQAPRYLEAIRARLDREGRIDPATRVRVNQDMALLAQILLRFIDTRDLEDGRALRVASYALRRIIYRCLCVVMDARVSKEYLERYIAGEVDPVEPGDDPTESGFFHALEGGEAELVDRLVVRMTERAFYLWLDGVCLDESNQAFEKEDSPFADREREVLAAITRGAEPRPIRRGDDLVPFLRRPDRDSLRILDKLEAWFLRSYDIPDAAAVIQHSALLEQGGGDGRRTLSWHTPRMHALELAVLALPFVAAAFFYERAPQLFDWWCTAEVTLVFVGVFWFLGWKFCIRRDLTFFNSSVPRIFAGVIVGYLPVFLIDEVWDLAGRSDGAVLGLTSFLGLTTLLYIYVEVRRRLGRTQAAFARARAIFLLGTLQAFVTGLLMTTLVGPFMVSRNWSPDGAADRSIEALRPALDPLVGELPRIVGVEPVVVFPAVVLLMTFLSFFIGVFLQLMWEDLPITEPL